MGIKIIKDETLTNLGNAIRSLTKTTEQLTPVEMASTLEAEENLIPSNIANGVKIFNIEGTRPHYTDNLLLSISANVNNAEITAKGGGNTVTGSLSNGELLLEVPCDGEWTINGTSGERTADTATATLKVADTVKVVFFEATVGCYIMGDVSTTITCTNGTKTYTSTGGGAQYFTVYERGSWTVSCEIDGATWKTVQNVQEHKKQYIEIFNEEIDPILNNNSWTLISIIANNGKGADYWSIGDAKEITLNGTAGAATYDNASLWAQIIGFNHNPDCEGTSSIHFQIGTTAQTGGTSVALDDAKYGSYTSNSNYFTMNSSSYNSGGWKSSKMRTITLPALKAIMPADLTSVIKTIPKYTDNVGGGSGHTESNISTTEDDLFLLSEFEVFGSQNYANSYEKNFQKQYAYYSVGNSKIRYKYSTTTSCFWWLRSPRYNYSNSFCNVFSDGCAGYYYAHYSCGCAPCFAL